MTTIQECIRPMRIFADTIPEFETTEFTDFPGRPDNSFYQPEVKWDKIAAAHNLANFNGFHPDYKETMVSVSDVPAFEQQLDKPRVTLERVTSYDRMAMQMRREENQHFTIFGAAGVVITRDNQIVIGPRGGEITEERRQTMGVGLYETVPAGGVAATQAFGFYNPFLETIVAEFPEELGNFDHSGLELCGLFEATGIGPKPICWVGRMNTDATLEQVQDVNRRANDLYDELIAKGATRQTAQEELASRGLPKDAWEHPTIMGIQNHPKAIDAALSYMLPHFAAVGVGQLKTYLDYMRTKGEFE